PITTLSGTFFRCEGILLVDRDARVVWISERYERYLPSLGLRAPSDMIGRPVEEVVPNTLMRRIVETGKPILLDIIDNDERSFVVSRFPLHNDRGDVIGAIGMILYDHIESLQPILARLGRLQRDLDEARRELASRRRTRYNFASFVGSAPATQEVKRRARKAAALNSTVLLIGETGTGKELIAQAIHAASAWAARPFIAVNVAAIPDALLEAEFFGVAPGAFTGAERRMRDGKLTLADGGTLLLDEIGDMPLALQAKLLRVLQEQQFEPVGSNQMIDVDVRVIAATSRDLKALVERGEFRADLYYRLAVVPIRLPPLRERAADLPALVEHLLEAIGEANGAPVKELTEDAVALLQGMPWPGNVRELHNLLEQACAMTERVRLTRADLLALLPPGTPSDSTPSTADAAAEPAPVRAPSGADALAATRTTSDVDTPAITLPQRIARLEREAIREALVATGGNRREAARRLGIARATLYERLKSLDVS
ncbi:MAG: sigma-54 interaction domain-containing protein, partial [Burkholderiaceae bacterium]